MLAWKLTFQRLEIIAVLVTAAKLRFSFVKSRFSFCII
jgi:hypothetical protein